MNQKTLALWSLVAGLLASNNVVHADVTPAALFRDHMVLQREVKVPVWGTADAAETVVVTIAGVSASAVTDAAGHWRVTLAEVPTGGPYAMTVAGKNTVTLQDVLVGDVWLCSGQSNMQFALGWNRERYAADIAAADDAMLRCFTVVDEASPMPLNELVAHPQQEWKVATPQSVLGFTAVGYYFARELRKEVGVPIGLIHSSWGGTPAEAWISREAMETDPELRLVADNQTRAMEARPEAERLFPGLMADWEAANNAGDKGDSGEALGWAKPEFDDGDWKTATVPLNFSQLGMKAGGAVWLRKTVDVPAESAGQDFLWKLNWGPDDAMAYCNGVPLGPPVGRAPELPKFYNTARTFKVPASVMRPGPNTFALRVFSHTDRGVVWQTTKRMQLPLAAFGPDADTWRFKTAFENPPLTPEAIEKLPKPPSAVQQNTATYIYNAKIAPLIPYAIRGTIWYQGESNVQNGLLYQKLLPTLIGDWRQRWGQGDLPFYIVQLANYGMVRPQPGQSGWAELREAQLLTARKVPNTGLAVTIDTGEAENIHPLNKQDVGHRLALAALSQTYGKDVKSAGPELTSMSVEGGQVRLQFSPADGGLVARGGPLKHFAVAGEDRKFVWADGRIEGESVVVSSKQVPNPVAVRYAWADNPEGCNLYNGAGLPASPFRTDDWPH